MQIQEVIDYILKHPKQYPGTHQYSQTRTNPYYKPYHPNEQLLVIFNCVCQFIQDNFMRGKGVKLHRFGTFTIDISTKTAETFKFNPLLYDSVQKMRQMRRHVHEVQPIFLPDTPLKQVLLRYNPKQLLQVAKSQYNHYQQGFQVIFLNPAPIARSCYLERDFVEQSLQVIWRAVKDLATHDSPVTLDFKLARLEIQNKNLSFTFTPEVIQQLNSYQFENNMRKSDDPCNTFWRESSQTVWRNSQLQPVNRPGSPQPRPISQQTRAIQEGSKDLVNIYKN